MSDPTSATTEQPTIKQRLARGEIVQAVTLVTPSAEAAAHVASLGFDIVWVEMEHSPITLETLRLMVHATRGRPAALFARVPANELWMAKRVLDQGVAGVIFPFIASASSAAKAAAACRYPPHGLRGSGAGLATATWPHAGNYYDSADENIVTVAVIENREGLDNIDEIAATPGIDVVFIGLSDLAFSLGCRGNWSGAPMAAAIDRIAGAAKRHSKPLGCPAPTPEDVHKWTTRGFQFFQTVTELGLMTRGAAGFVGNPVADAAAKTVSPKPLY